MQLNSTHKPQGFWPRIPWSLLSRRISLKGADSISVKERLSADDHRVIGRAA